MHKRILDLMGIIIFALLSLTLNAASATELKTKAELKTKKNTPICRAVAFLRYKNTDDLTILCP